MPEKTAPAAAAAPDFETAMGRLEQIVGQMESDQLPLHELIEKYEEGSKLIQYCQGTLETAEKRIEMVQRKATLASTAAAAAPEPATETPSPKTAKKTDTDVSLF